MRRSSVEMEQAGGMMMRTRPLKLVMDLVPLSHIFSYAPPPLEKSTSELGEVAKAADADGSGVKEQCLEMPEGRFPRSDPRQVLAVDRWRSPSPVHQKVLTHRVQAASMAGRSVSKCSASFALVTMWSRRGWKIETSPV
jgi:hypothetical protein